MVSKCKGSDFLGKNIISHRICHPLGDIFCKIHPLKGDKLKTRIFLFYAFD